MHRDIQGTYITTSTVGEAVQAFVPAPLPPIPPVVWEPKLRDKFDRALVALGRLDSVSVLLPDTGLFLYMYVRKEAVLSSQIEGTQSSLSDLLLYEVKQQPGVPLNHVRLTGDWEAWLDFFAEAVIETAGSAVRTAQNLVQLAETDRQRIHGLGRTSGSALRVHQAMLARPLSSPAQLSEQTELSPATIGSVLLRLEKLGIVKEISGYQRNRLYSYVAYVALMNQGTELPV